MSVIEDIRKVMQDFLAPELREIQARLDAHDQRLSDVIEQLKELRADTKQGFRDVQQTFQDLRADLRLSQRVEEIERTLRSSPKQ